MRRFWSSAAAVISLWLVAGGVVAAEIGQPLPAVIGVALDSGEQRRVEQFRGKVLLVDVWASWCPPCRVSLPIMQGWRERYAAQGFEVLGINVDTDLAAARRALKMAGADYPIMHSVSDEQLARLNLVTIPMSFLLDREGRVRHIHQGFRREEAAQVEAEIQQLLRQSQSPES